MDANTNLGRGTSPLQATAAEKFKPVAKRYKNLAGNTNPKQLKDTSTST